GRVYRGGASPPTEGAVLVEDGLISWVGVGRPPGSPAAVLEAPDGALIAPGFIDLQVNGACGEDTAAGPDAIAAISAALPAYGVTAAIGMPKRAGSVVAAGHTAADYETARLAIEAGVTFGTHVFNAMTTFLHRHPGVVGALLDDRRVTVGVVADGHHLHPATCSHVLRTKGWRRVALTTDQTAAAGMPPGPYRLSGREVVGD